ncbi:Fumarylacetoacetate hydrolase domain-containing protein 2 [Colletotrichum gloeosporioides]|uniref:Fumarylacetoacetate hydrolase domain-containing protein 2 n=1 Tax=Colletotrichum gloeosporioides TaxID=474922 RepID=A0A8H4C7A2_COLGL|nr:Fumarylacetoacetate hydrolase domain-containing protein 2 [Colletotrichum gloeosporioides]KAF3798748.1 Fumarylacetoacetate hydrolase domain-containing protein 2 [Colletotrichum gloeosporioides]
MSFDRLIRFVDEEGRTSYGDLDKPLAAKEIIGTQVTVVVGTLQHGFTKTNEKRTVKEVRSALSPIEVVGAPSVLCAGLNYKLHSNETNVRVVFTGNFEIESITDTSRQFVIPTKPVIFMTPAERLTGPLDDIIAHDDAQPMLDYEGELVFVLSKDAKDVKEEDALNYVLGYTVGNDVSARSLVPVEISGNQMGHSKSFDTFGPIGPCITSTKLIPDPQALHLVTTVNGEKRQDTKTGEMIFSVKQLIAYASKNRTLKQGTVVMTGTPNGVGWFSNGLLGHGDVVDVEISGIGSISNKVVFK